MNLLLQPVLAVRRSRSSGKERDAETGLDYFGARYYGSNNGRWMSPDAPFADQSIVDPQRWNLYMYVRNSPERYIDPTGRWMSWDHDRIIDHALSSVFSASERDELKQVSAWVDTPKFQAPGFSYMHGMAKPGQSPADAEREMNQYVDFNLNEAVESQMEAEEGSGYKGGYSLGALMFVGMAVHAVADSADPIHNFSVWSGGLQMGPHGVVDLYIGTVGHLGAAVIPLTVAEYRVKRTVQDFQDKLKAERARRAREAERKSKQAKEKGKRSMKKKHDAS